MAHIFISYRREDSPYIAATIHEKMKQSFGPESVFFDIDTLPLGVDFREHIGNAVGGCDALVAVIGDGWAGSTNDDPLGRLDDSADYVRIEIESALERDIPVIPVLVDNAEIPEESKLPESLKSLRFRNSTEVRAGADLQQQLERLVRGVQTVCGVVLEGEANAAPATETPQSRDRRAQESRTRDRRTQESQSRDRRAEASQARDRRAEASQARDRRAKESEARDRRAQESRDGDRRAQESRDGDRRAEPTRDRDRRAQPRTAASGWRRRVTVGSLMLTFILGGIVVGAGASQLFVETWPTYVAAGSVWSAGIVVASFVWHRF